MRRRQILAGLVGTGAHAGSAAAQGLGEWLQQGQQLLGGGDARAPLDPGAARVAAGLQEALRVATDRVVAQLGRPGGFAADPLVRVPLPGGLDRVRAGLVAAGLGALVEDLEARMNHAAERAVPAAGELFREAVLALTIEDARALLAGPDDAATRYLETRMRPPLAERLTPIVDTELQQAGAVAAFDAFVAEYSRLPLMPSIAGTLTRHVVDSGLGGLFFYLGAEERAIRHDPAARTTLLLRTVFADG